MRVSFRADIRARGHPWIVLGGVFIASMWGLLYPMGLYSVHRGVWTRWFEDFLFESYISAIVEELAFRAVLLRICARLWGVRNGVLWSSLLFGLVHITHVPNSHPR
jgi:membrane protease YdiL (CAAX protease family)